MGTTFSRFHDFHYFKDLVADKAHAPKIDVFWSLQGCRVGTSRVVVANTTLLTLAPHPCSCGTFSAFYPLT